VEATERDDREMLDVTRDWRHWLRDWLRSPDPHIPVWLAFIAFIMLVLIAVFSVNAFMPGGIGDLIGGSSGGSESSSDSGSDSATAPESPAPALTDDAAADTADGSAAEEPAAPAHFVGTIVSDNGWFTLTVTADGQVSGTLNVQQTVQGDSVIQSGSYAGSIGADDVVTCTGTFSGTSYAANGQQWPHQGTVSVRAVPVNGDRTVWEIDVDGEPGEPATLPAHAR
jgi:hypothetical protein